MWLQKSDARRKARGRRSFAAQQFRCEGMAGVWGTWRGSKLGSLSCQRSCDEAVRKRLRELAAVRRRFGYRRLPVLMRREGLVMNHKKFRLYREERLQVRRRGGRKRTLGTRAPLAIPQGPTSAGASDFLSDAFADSRRFRIWPSSTTLRANAWFWSPIPHCRACGSRASSTP
jgi:transposase InsO family protein